LQMGFILVGNGGEGKGRLSLAYRGDKQQKNESKAASE